MRINKNVVITKNAAVTVKLINGVLLKAERARGDSIFALTPAELQRRLKKETHQGKALEKIMEDVNIFWEKVM